MALAVKLPLVYKSYATILNLDKRLLFTSVLIAATHTARGTRQTRQTTTTSTPTLRAINRPTKGGDVGDPWILDAEVALSATLQVSSGARGHFGLDLLHNAERVGDVAVGGVGDFLEEDIELEGREAIV